MLQPAAVPLTRTSKSRRSPKQHLLVQPTEPITWPWSEPTGPTTPRSVTGGEQVEEAAAMVDAG